MMVVEWDILRYMGVSINGGTPVIIHFRLGFSLTKTIQRFGGTPLPPAHGATGRARVQEGSVEFPPGGTGLGFRIIGHFTLQ